MLDRLKRSKIRPTDKGIFDPYAPISSLKPMSVDYVPAAVYTSDATAEFDEPPSDQAPAKPLLFWPKFGIIVAVSILAVRLIDLQIVQGEQNYSLAKGNQLKAETVPAPRGLIYDSSGAPLVSNIPNYSVVLDSSSLPRVSTARSAFISKLASALGTDAPSLTKQINANDTLSQVTLSDNLSRDQAMALELKLNNASFSGVSLEAVPVRQYSESVPDLSHLLGYIGKPSAETLKERPGLLPTSYVGKSGLEQQYDAQLQGTPGINTVEVNSSGQTIRLVSSQPPQPGQSLVLNLDSALQQVTASALETSIQANKATSGAAVVLNPQNGQVLAMVSEPTFDNNLFSQTGNSAARQAALTDPLSPLLNRAIAGLYPSGSTVKPFVAAGALQAGVITASTKFDTSQPITVGAQTFHDWTTHGISNVEQAIAQSNDIFFYTVGGGHGAIGGLGIDRLDQYLSDFGFGSKTGIDLPGEGAGNVPSPAWKQKTENQKWYLGDTYNLSIGQGGFLVTPLQLANATAAIANGGTLYQPQMVKSFVSATGTTKNVAPVVDRSNMISSANITTVQQGMFDAVQPGGSAHSTLGSLPLQIAAKTGTAQITQSLTGTQAWFTAYAPYQNPQIAVAVLVEDGGEGFDVAGPVVRQIIEQYFHLPLTPIVAAPAGG